MVLWPLSTCRVFAKKIEREILQGHVKTRDSSFKLKESRFRSDIRKKKFIMRVVRNWDRLLREILDHWT